MLLALLVWGAKMPLLNCEIINDLKVKSSGDTFMYIYMYIFENLFNN